MAKSSIPRILLITYYPPNRSVGSIYLLDPIIRNYDPSKFIWFSTTAPLTDREMVVDFRGIYSHGYKPSRPRREPFATWRRYINTGLWGWYLARQAARLGRENAVELVWTDLVLETVVAGRVAAQLLNVPLFVTVFDDQPAYLAVAGYPQWFCRLFQLQFKKTLLAARGHGVICKPMADYYKETYGIDSTVFYPGVERSSCLPQKEINTQKLKPIVIGTIGTHYSDQNWLVLIGAVRLLNEKYGKNRFTILQIGNLNPSLHSPEVEVTGWLADREFKQSLSRIDVSLVHLPFDAEYHIISQTSFPTKISSFIQAQRPLIAFGPAYSSIVTLVEEYKCGVTCISCDVASLVEVIEALVFIPDRVGDALKGMARLKEDFSRDNFFKKFEMLVDKASNSLRDSP
jgi:hypothetical protein